MTLGPALITVMRSVPRTLSRKLIKLSAGDAKKPPTVAAINREGLIFHRDVRPLSAPFDLYSKRSEMLYATYSNARSRPYPYFF